MSIQASAGDLGALISSRNPFTDNRINAPGDDVDLAGLHTAPFEQLTQLAGEALAERRGLGVVLSGEAGIGKSHLLSRLDRWARTSNQARMIYLHNLQAAPGALPRILLRSIVAKLTWADGTSYLHTDLFQLLHGALQNAAGPSAGLQTWSWLRQVFAQIAENGSASAPTDAALADRTVADVLFRFYRSVRRRVQGKEDGATANAAVQWLRGEALPPEHAGLLALPPAHDRNTLPALEDEQQIKQVLVTLTRLAAANQQPFILAFDQVDNLSDEQATVWARFVEAVIDGSRDLLVITAGIQTTLDDWRERRIIPASAWDRLAQSQISLDRIDQRQARQLLERRLQCFLAPFEGNPDVRQRVFEDSLFPLGSTWFDVQFHEGQQIRPRDVLSGAAEAWRREQEWLAQQGAQLWLAGWKARVTGGESLRRPEPRAPIAVDELIDQIIEERLVEHAAALRGKPPERDSLAEVLAQLLDECQLRDPGCPLLRVRRTEPNEDGKYPPYELILEHMVGEGRTMRSGLALTYDLSTRALAPRLEKLSNDTTGLDRLILVTAEAGLSQVDRGNDRLQQLQNHYDGLVELHAASATELIALDALSACLNQARGEDVEIFLPDGKRRTVTAGEVAESYHRHGRLAASSLLAILLARPPAPPTTTPASVAVEAYDVTEMMPVLSPPGGAVLLAEPVAAEAATEVIDAPALAAQEDAAYMLLAEDDAAVITDEAATELLVEDDALEASRALLDLSNEELMAEEVVEELVLDEAVLDDDAKS